ncbi:transposase [Streptomyces olivaceus]
MKNYPPEFKADAVALYESRPEATIRSVAADLGINPETLRNWVRAAGASRPRGRRTQGSGPASGPAGGGERGPAEDQWRPVVWMSEGRYRTRSCRRLCPSCRICRTARRGWSAESVRSSPHRVRGTTTRPSGHSGCRPRCRSEEGHSRGVRTSALLLECRHLTVCVPERRGCGHAVITSYRVRRARATAWASLH